jgi:pyridoxal phosphate enzyme (YggS family)
MYRYIEKNLLSIREGIAAAARRAGRDPDGVTLAAVTKGATDDEVRALLSLGVTEIAENRTSLFLHRQKIAEEMGVACHCHLIGSLQTNKVKTVVGKTHLIHSVDRPSLVRALEKEAAKAGVVLHVLAEVNSGREENKGGALPEELSSLISEITACPHLVLMGLMTMGPDLDAETYRRCFRETREAFDRLTREGIIPENGVLSMGMSGSYEIAVEEGATLVRVGSALFKKD